MGNTSDVLRYGTEDGEAGVYLPFAEPYDLAYRGGWEWGFVKRKARERGVNPVALEMAMIQSRWAKPQPPVQSRRPDEFGLVMPKTADTGEVVG